MEDKGIDEVLYKIYNHEDQTLVFDKCDDIAKMSQDRFTKYTKEYRGYEYMEKDLNLITVTNTSYDSYIVYGLTSKGRYVLKNDGWIKSNKAKDLKKQAEKRKSDFSYWLGIIIPFSMLLIALWESKSDNQEMRNDIIKEVKVEQMKQKEMLQYNIQILTKKMDSVLKITEKKK